MTKIYIEYALSNFGSITNTKYNISQGHWAREHCLNGYVFTLHQSFIGNDAAINAVEAASSAWAEELGITLELEKVINEVGEEAHYFHNDTSSTERNIIWFGDFLTATTLMETGTSKLPDETDSNNLGPDKNWIFGSNIKIRETNLWDYSTSGEINYVTNRDFYGTLLHEIGHALGIAHSIQLEAGLIDEKSLMHPYVRTSGIVSDDDRTSLNQHGEEAKLAAQRLANDSRTHEWSETFSDLHGLETLAASGVNSDVQPTPEIDIKFIDPQHVLLYPEPLDTTNNYTHYWWPSGEETDSLARTICKRRIRPSTHYVRIKDDACTVSSLYSLPTTIGRECLGFGRGDEDNSTPMIHPLIKIYPNPTKGQFNIQFNPIEGEEIPYTEDTYIGVYDNLGNLQKQYNIGDTLRQTTIDISTLPAGTYWVVWFVDGEVIEAKQVYKN